MTALTSEQRQQAQQWLTEADAILITAGAGLGVDSGLPDFRGNQGFWQAYPALAQAGIEFTEVANPLSFRQHPRLAWGFYGHRLALYRRTVPHQGFDQIKQYAESRSQGYFVFTSNVDGQFQKAGFDTESIMECHGSIHELQCTWPCSHTVWSAQFEVITDDQHCQWLGALPLCPNCQALARPNILMFNDRSYVPQRTVAQEERLMRWLQEPKRLVIIELGAGTAIPSVRHLGESVHRSFPDSTFIRINPREYQLPKDSLRSLAIPLGAQTGIAWLLDNL